MRHFLILVALFWMSGSLSAQDGSLDPTFDPGTGASNVVDCIAIQPDGKIIIGGQFNYYNGTPRKFIAKLNADGSLDETFNPGTGPNSTVWTTAIQPDGKIIIGGYFNMVNGTSSRYIARLNSDGSSDPGFNPGTLLHGVEFYSSRVQTCAIQTDGKILVGGLFTNTTNGTTRNGIMRLNANGSLDPSFNAITGLSSTEYVTTMTIQPDGKIIIGGNFGFVGGQDIARLNADGSVDLGFGTGSGSTGELSACAIQPDGRILLAGTFSLFNGTPMHSMARLNPDGTLDTGFNPGSESNSGINTIALQADGKIMTAGDIYLADQWVGIIRRNADGSVDSGFDQGAGMSGGLNGVYGLAIQPDGNVIIGGDFTSYNGTVRNRIARLNGTARTGIRVMFEGPYATGTMTDALRTLTSFPLTEPFTAMGYAETGFVSGATIGSSVLSTTGNNAIVDWVLVEMRPVATPGTVAASRAVLLQRDGDVVDLDGVSTVGFAGLTPGNYCVAVKPRNHLPVMLSATTPVSYGSAVATVDFTLPTTQVFDNDARKNVGGVMVLAAGDVTFNEVVSYTGTGNDRDPILTRVGSNTPNNSVSGYWREDVNMDGVVKYTGPNNDRDRILVNVGSTTPNNTRVATLP